MKATKTLIYLVATLLILAACSDELTESLWQRTDGTDTEAICFFPETIEQASITIGTTRSGSDGEREALPSHEFTGNAFGLKAHSLTLPLVEIHPGAASVTTENAGAETRASTNDIARNDNFHDSLTIWGFTDKRSLFTSATKSATLKKIREWRSSVHWPYDGTSTDDPNKSTYMKFFAVSPSMEEMEITLTNQASIGFHTPPSFTYHVPNEPSLQKDLLYGQSKGETKTVNGTETSGVIEIWKGPYHKASYKDGWTQDGYKEGWTQEGQLGNDNKFVDIEFEHILTAVRFAQGKMPKTVKITEIQLQSIANRATFNGSTKTWGTPQGEATNYGNYTIKTSWQPSYYSPEEYTTNDAAKYPSGENVYIDNNQVLFLLPHTCSDLAKLQVKLVEVDEEGNEKVDGSGQPLNHTISTELKDDVWRQGYTLTYLITIGELRGDYQLIATPHQVFEHYEHDFTKSFNVTSYRAFTDYSADENGTPKQSHTVKWKIAGFYEDEEMTTSCERPDWLEVSEGVSTAVDGGVDHAVNFTLKAQSPVSTIDHAANLKNNSQYNGDADLSKFTISNGQYVEGGTQNTANCYIVNRCRSIYKIPMVYGNGITNGSDITSSNTVCVDHEGDVIKKAWILEQLSGKIRTTSEITTSSSTQTETETQTESNYGSASDQGDITAEIVWQDKEGLFSMTGDNKNITALNNAYLFFTGGIDGGEGVQPGNCVIALKAKKRTRTQTRTRTRPYQSTKTTSKEENVSDEKGTKETVEGSLDEGNFPRTKTTTTVKVTEDDEGKRTKTTTVVTETVSSDWTAWGDYTAWSAWSTAATADILWTWHIWMTDEVYPNSSSDSNKLVTLKDASGANVAQIMPVNLGWVPDAEFMTQKVYAPRKVWLKIVMCDNGGTEQESWASPVKLKIEQHARQPLATGTSTVYQWGRPTALPMVKDINEKKRTALSSYMFSRKTSTHIAEGISNPMSFMRNTDDKSWGNLSTTHANLWGSSAGDANGSISNKTLYDPCPPGFCIPQGEIFRGFSMVTEGDGTILGKTGENLNIWANPGKQNYDGTNVEDHRNAELKKGAYFYVQAHTSLTDEDRYGKTIYMPSTGYWSVAGADVDDISTTEADNDQNYGAYWTSKYDKDKAADNKGYCLWFTPQKGSGSANNIFFNYQRCDDDKSSNTSSALPIRPTGKGVY